MATSWIVETLTSAVTSVDNKTAYLADTKYFTIEDSSGSNATIFKILNDSSDYYSMQLFGHSGQSAKLYITADQGEDLADSWLWQVADAGTMTWALRTAVDSGSADLEVEDDTYTTKLTLDTSGNLTTVGDLTISGGNITNVLVCNQTVQIVGQLTVNAGIAMSSGHLDVVDDVKFKLGTGDDLEIYHDGSNSYIANSTGALKLATESSGIAVTIGHGTSETTIADNLNVAGDTVLTGDLAVNGDNITCDGNLEIDSTNFTVDATGDIVLDAAGGDFTVSVGDTSIMELDTNSEIFPSTGTGDNNTLFGYDCGNSIQAGATANTFFGHSAGTGITTGNNNTLIGMNTGDATDDGNYNTAVGAVALSANCGDGNTAFGSNALKVTTGSRNTAIGNNAGALMAATITDTTVLGSNALYTADDNSVEGIVAIGAYSAYSLGDVGGASETNGGAYIGMNAGRYLGATGSNYNKENTIIGHDALGGGETDDLPGNTAFRNTAIGYRALRGPAAGTGSANITGYRNAAVGCRALMENTTGNHNVAINYESLNSNSTGSHNIAIGSKALYTSTTGDYNIAIGTNALTAGNGGSSVCIGHEAGTNLTSGSSTLIGNEAGENALDPGTITAVGYRAGRGAAFDTYAVATCRVTNSDATVTCGSSAIYVGDVVSGTGVAASQYVSSITTGTEGTSVTEFELSANATAGDGGSDVELTFAPAISGNYNTVMGTNAGLNLRGQSKGNTLLGREAGHQMTYGYYNVFIGNEAAQKATSNTYQNVSIGYQSGNEMTTGYNNTFVGNQAGNTLTTGHGCVAIGRNSDVTAGGINQIAIGHTTATDGDNKGRWGNSSVTTNNIQTDWTEDSDRRIKDNIEDSSLGLSFINSLKSRTFTKIHPADYPEPLLESRYKSGGSNYDDDKNEIIRDKFDDKKIRNGLIAQEVKESMDSFGVDFSGWGEELNGKQGVSYSKLAMPLIKAVQELSAQVEELKNKLGE